MVAGQVLPLLQDALDATSRRVASDDGAKRLASGHFPLFCSALCITVHRSTLTRKASAGSAGDRRGRGGERSTAAGRRTTNSARDGGGAARYGEAGGAAAGEGGGEGGAGSSEEDEEDLRSVVLLRQSRRPSRSSV